MTHEIPTDQMMADLKATFPGLFLRRLSDYGARFSGRPGVQTGGFGEGLVGDEPIFSDTAYSLGVEGYDGPVHKAFISWLEARGWAWEWEDGDVFFLLPISAFAERTEAA